MIVYDEVFIICFEHITYERGFQAALDAGERVICRNNNLVCIRRLS